MRKIFERSAPLKKVFLDGASSRKPTSRLHEARDEINVVEVRNVGVRRKNVQHLEHIFVSKEAKQSNFAMCALCVYRRLEWPSELFYRDTTIRQLTIGGANGAVRPC